MNWLDNVLLLEKLCAEAQWTLVSMKGAFLATVFSARWHTDAEQR